VGWLIAARVLQAIGGSMLNPVAMSIIRNTFDDPRERAQAIGVWGAVVGVSMALGPVLGGMVADRYGLLATFYFLAATIVIANLFVIGVEKPEPERAARGAL